MKDSLKDVKYVQVVDVTNPAASIFDTEMLGFVDENNLKACVRVCKAPEKNLSEARFPVRKNGKFGFIDCEAQKAKEVDGVCAASRQQSHILSVSAIMDMLANDNALN